jgi:hypothetical protein
VSRDPPACHPLSPRTGSNPPSVAGSSRCSRRGGSRFRSSLRQASRGATRRSASSSPQSRSTSNEVPRRPRSTRSPSALALTASPSIATSPTRAHPARGMLGARAQDQPAARPGRLARDRRPTGSHQTRADAALRLLPPHRSRLGQRPPRRRARPPRQGDGARKAPHLPTPGRATSCSPPGPSAAHGARCCVRC